MKTTAHLTVLVLLVICTATMARADIARPEPKPTEPPAGKVVFNTALEIIPDSKTSSARLQISEGILKALRETMTAGGTTQSFGQRLTGSSTNTVVAGLFLFLSISFGGVWLARSSGKTKSHKAVAAALVACATVSTFAIIAQGNAGPPPSYLWRNLSKNLSTSKTTSGPIDIEIVPEGHGVKLIVPTRDASRTTDD